MNRKIVLLLTALMVCMMLNSCTTTTLTHASQVSPSNENIASADWNDGTYQVSVFVDGLMYIIGSGAPSRSLSMSIMIFGPDVQLRGTLDLSPEDFEWSMNHARLSTYFDGHSLVIEWKTNAPTKTTHINEYFDYGKYTVHEIQNANWRTASAEFSWNGIELGPSSQTSGSVNRLTFTWIIIPNAP